MTVVAEVERRLRFEFACACRSIRAERPRAWHCVAWRRRSRDSLSLYSMPRKPSHRLATVPDMATRPGALIVHADTTVMACTEDDDQDGCHGRDLRHDGDAIRCWSWTLSGCNYCGMQ
jgi:hypothetical protein